jgi:hypothetical protein
MQVLMSTAALGAAPWKSTNPGGDGWGLKFKVTQAGFGRRSAATTVLDHFPTDFTFVLDKYESNPLG